MKSSSFRRIRRRTRRACSTALAWVSLRSKRRLVQHEYKEDSADKEDDEHQTKATGELTESGNNAELGVPASSFSGSVPRTVNAALGLVGSASTLGDSEGRDLRADLNKYSSHTPVMDFSMKSLAVGEQSSHDDLERKENIEESISKEPSSENLARPEKPACPARESFMGASAEDVLASMGIGLSDVNLKPGYPARESFMASAGDVLASMGIGFSDINVAKEEQKPIENPKQRFDQVWDKEEDGVNTTFLDRWKS